MYQLMYISNVVNLMDEDDLNSVLEQARIKNKKLNITGMLVYHEGAFMQILEGQEDDVKSLMKTISDDPRHNNIEILEEVTVSERCFPSWDMAFRKLTYSDIEKYPMIEQLLANHSPEQNAKLSDVTIVFLSLIRGNY